MVVKPLVNTTTNNNRGIKLILSMSCIQLLDQLMKPEQFFDPQRQGILWPELPVYSQL